MGRAGRIQIAAGAAMVALLVVAVVVARASENRSEESAGSTTVPVSTTVPPGPTPSPGPEPVSLPTATPAELEGLHFTDVTAAAGLDAPQSKGRLGDDIVMAGGAAVGDVDGDADPDVFLTRVGRPDRLLENDGKGRFTEVTREAGLPTSAARADAGHAAAVFADVDGDQDLDLYTTAIGTGTDALYLNDGEGRFEDGTARSGLTNPKLPLPPGAATLGAAFADVDHDGDLDLATAQWYTAPLAALSTENGGIGHLDITKTNDQNPSLCGQAAKRSERPDGSTLRSRNRLLLNDGTGRYTDATAAWGLKDADGIVGYQPTFADVDSDGWDDLLYTGDFCTSRLYRNDGGQAFENITSTAGVGTDENGMGSVVEDLDGDGNLDWFVSGIRYPTRGGACAIYAPSIGCSGNRLYLGDGHGKFRDATDRLGVRDAVWGWGAAAADFDLDGRRDLFVANGYRDRKLAPSIAEEANLRVYRYVDGDPSRLWMGADGAPWKEAATAAGLTDRTNGKAAVPFDADGDGDLDLLVATTNGRPRLYRNDLPAGRHWLAVRLTDPGSANPDAVGAVVRLDLGDGRPPLVLVAKAGGTFQSGDPAVLHAGLGDHDVVRRIEVRWPGDPTPQVLTDVRADQVLTVERD